MNSNFKRFLSSLILRQAADRIDDQIINNSMNLIQSYTLCDSERIKNISRLSQYILDSGIPGDFVECGTYKGGVGAILSQYLGEDRHLWLFDSFEGMPQPSTRDGKAAQTWVGECRASVDDVKDVMRLVNTPPEKYSIIQGWFNHTLNVDSNIPKRIALLHCDADWYESVSLVLQKLYPLVEPGGCIILDDFGYWEGCREAFYDFCATTNEKPLLERCGSTQCYWVKGRQHNR
jgi:O-methyltransferase